MRIIIGIYSYDIMNGNSLCVCFKLSLFSKFHVLLLCNHDNLGKRSKWACAGVQARLSSQHGKQKEVWLSEARAQILGKSGTLWWEKFNHQFQSVGKHIRFVLKYQKQLFKNIQSLNLTRKSSSPWVCQASPSHTVRSRGGIGGSLGAWSRAEPGCLAGFPGEALSGPLHLHSFLCVPSAPWGPQKWILYCSCGNFKRL